MAVVTNVALNIDKGQTFKADFIVKDEDGDVVDLTDYQANMQARSDNGALILSLSTPDNSNRIAITALSGKIAIVLSYDKTRLLPVGTFPFEVELVNGSGEHSIIVTGTLTISEGVIR